MALAVSHKAGVARIVIDRPAARNALDVKTLDALIDAYESLGIEKSVRAIVITGAGKAFCAGGDLAEKKTRGLSSGKDYDGRAIGKMLGAVHACPKPTLALVNGAAYGAGLALVAACDLAVGSTVATFCLPETRLAIFPSTIAPFVIRALGERAFRALTLLADPIDANCALRLGLVHRVCELNALQQNGELLLASLLRNNSGAMAAAKKVINALGHPMFIDERMIETYEQLAGLHAYSAAPL